MTLALEKMMLQKHLAIKSWGGLAAIPGIPGMERKRHWHLSAAIQHGIPMTLAALTHGSFRAALQKPRSTRTKGLYYHSFPAEA